MKRSSGIAMLLVFLVGCSSSGPFRGSEYEQARKTETFPFLVKVSVQQSEPSTTQGVLVPRLVSSSMRADIERSVVEALKGYRVFAYPYRGDLADRKPDLELKVDISAPKGRELGKVTRNGYVWPNTFLWLLAGFPGWIIEDTEVDTGIQVTYQLAPTADTDAKPIQSGSVNLAPDQRLSFWDRASAWQYVQQIIIPPFLISSDKEVADRSLYQRFLERMQGTIGGQLKRGFMGQLMGNPQGPQPFLAVLPRGNSTVLLLCDAPIELSQVEEPDGAGKVQSRRPKWTAVAQKQKLLELLDQASAPPELRQAADRFGETKGGYAYCYVTGDVQRDTLRWPDQDATRAPRVSVKFQGDATPPWTWTPRLTSPPNES